MIHTTQEYRIGDARKLTKELPAESIDLVVTSPPYWGLRDYGVDGQIGLEGTLEEYHTRLLEVTAECMRVLKQTGVMFWNHGDNYGGSGGSGGDYNEGGLREGQAKVGKNGGLAKCLAMQNERLIIRMIDEQGWILRNRIIWSKPNGMPSSVTDRFSNKYEPVYMLVKSKKYWFDLDAVRVPHKEASLKRWKPGTERVETTADVKNAVVKKVNSTYITAKSGDLLNTLGKNPGDVWTIPTQPYPGSHFATFPPSLIEPMIRAACPAEICPVCGLARERITEKEVLENKSTPYNTNTDFIHHGEGKATLRSDIKRTTTGWTSCSCNAGWIAGTVLDPFCGSGTVPKICRLLNLNAIVFDLNPEYEQMIRERSMAHTPPLTSYLTDPERPAVIA